MKKTYFFILIAIFALGGGALWYLQSGKSLPELLQSAISGNPAIKNEPADSDSRVTFKDYGLASEFAPTIQWLNLPDSTIGPTNSANTDSTIDKPEVTLTDLRGKVILLNFWTLSCNTCANNLDTLNHWYETYHDQGLVVIGFHTPQYAFEKSSSNVQAAVARFAIPYPIALDNSYALWKAYGAQLWPTQILIDKSGHIVYKNSEDGHTAQTENAIRQLLGTTGGIVTKNGTDIVASSTATRTTFSLGADHGSALANTEPVTTAEQVYTLPTQQKNGTYALEGTWKFDSNKITLTQGYGRIRLKIKGKSLRLLTGSIKPIVIQVYADGERQPDISIQTLQSYLLFNGDQAATHSIDITAPQPGIELYQFSFEQ